MNTAMVPTCIGQGLADGHKARLVEFERFEFKFKQCLSSSAISTKFEQHHTRGTEIVAELQQLLESEELFVQEKRSFDNLIHFYISHTREGYRSFDNKV